MQTWFNRRKIIKQIEKNSSILMNDDDNGSKWILFIIFQKRNIKIFTIIMNKKKQIGTKIGWYCCCYYYCDYYYKLVESKREDLTRRHTPKKKQKKNCKREKRSR